MRAAHALRGGVLRLQAAVAAGRQSEVAWHGLGSGPLTSGLAATSLWQHALTAAAAVLPGALQSASSHSDAAVGASFTEQATDPGQQQLQASPQQAWQQQQQQQEQQEQQAASDKKRRRRHRRRGGGEGGSNSSGDAALQASVDRAERWTRRREGEGRPSGSAFMGPPPAVEAEAEAGAPESVAAPCPLPPARVLQDDAHPIREADISRPAWSVLSRLRAAGHEAYVVGGTIRDLLLGGTPRDYDILTSAELHQIKRLFSRSHIVGRSFPVCHVHAEGTVIEVSSFSTHADSRLIPADASSHMIGRQKSKRWSDEGATWAAARTDNAVRRDFTVNGLLYDPFSRLLFDSVAGVEDCAARRLRTICPPDESFTKDPARVLRGVRLAARAGLTVDAATAAAMEAHAPAIVQLPQGRLQMELGSLLGYGAARPSLGLMWRLGLLDMLLPQQARYLKRHRVARAPRSARSAIPVAAPGGDSKASRENLLYELAAELDSHVHPQKPVDPCVWLALLAAPLVVDSCQKQRQWHYRQQVQVASRSLLEGKEQQQEEDAGSGEAEHSSSDSSTDDGSSSESDATDGSDGSESDSGYTSGSSTELLEAGSGSSRAGTLQGWQDGEGGQGLAPTLNEQQRRRRYLDRYGRVVTRVFDTMLQGLDSATAACLGRQAQKHAAQLREGGSQWQRGRRARPAPQAEQAARQVLLPCVLSRAAVDRAAALLMLEADLRGRPELQALLCSSGWTGPAAADTAGAHAAHAGGLGRHSEQHALWRRLERSLAQTAGGDGGADGDAAAEQAAAGGSRRQPKRQRPGRSLSAEERLVLGILSDPRFDFAARTALAV